MRGEVEKKAKKEEEETFFVSAFLKEVALLFVASHACKLSSLVSRITLKLQNRKGESEGGLKKWRERQEFLFFQLSREGGEGGAGARGARRAP